VYGYRRGGRDVGRWGPVAALGITVTQVPLPFIGQCDKPVTKLISRSGAYDLMFFPPTSWATSWP
jgi:hypothetical protein